MATIKTEVSVGEWENRAALECSGECGGSGSRICGRVRAEVGNGGVRFAADAEAVPGGDG